MSDAFARCVAFVLAEEGGFCCLKDDPGGATCRGITGATLADWRGCAVTVKDVETLTEAEACDIYRARYWKAVRGDDLPLPVALVVLDSAVNSGPVQAAKWLQAACGLPRDDIDGKLGPRTLAALRDHDPLLLAHEVARLRLAFLRSLKTWPVFGKGWAARIMRLRRAVDAMK